MSVRRRQGPGRFFDAQFFRCKVRPMRVGQMRAAYRNQVELTGFNCFFGQFRLTKTPSAGDRNTRFTAHTLGNRPHERRPPRNVGVRRAETDANTQQVQTTRLEATRQFDRLGEGLLITTVVLEHAETCRQRQVFRPDFTYRRQRFKQETAAVIEAAAVFVGTLVGVLGEETLPQITVGKVQLDPLKACITGTTGSIDEVLTNAGDVVQGHGARHFRQVGTERNGGRRNGVPATRIGSDNVIIAFPRTVGAGLAACVGDLDARHATGVLDGFDDRHECLRLLVIPDTGATGGDPAFRCNGGGFNHQQTRTTTRHAGQVNVVPVIDDTVDCRVLAHRWNGDSVAQRDVFQFEGFEQCRHWKAPVGQMTLVFSCSMVIELWQ
ncbi:Urease accessory protein UreD [Pseudomonas syringae pv. delphinii]|uniref:Urease accessory protein UreD n=1 Tax=Pseudomonas syringae pv. delphinii TaxID=192088 RepID=A0A0P9Q951_9PSED|nr:Uncharacterized protein ALO72_04992 [Pseudomonas syringae pv. delphinii]RMQ29742.1 Urease accessory protein UreD [Pseudomonas syringae pv. delphinii]